MTASDKSFNGFWDNATNDNISATAKLLKEEKLEPKTKIKRSKAKNPYGVGSIVIAFLIFLIASSIMTAIYIAVSGVGTAEDLITDPGYLLLSMLTMHVSWIVSAYFLSKRGTDKSFSETINLKVKWRDIPIGLGYAAAFFVFSGLLSAFFTYVLKLDTAAAENTSTFTQFNGIWLFVFAGVMVSCIGPLAEEIFFRGFIYQGLKNSLGLVLPKGVITVPSLLITSFFFGMMHFQPDSGNMWWVTVLVTGLLGLFMGIISILHKRLGPAIFAHMFYNATAISLALSGMS